MHHEPLLRTCLACAVIVSVWAAAPGGQYSITVNRDRLINAQNEPQNWLLMNGDYGSQRYSKLTQINRDNVGELRMVWALALGGMQDTGRNGPESELNPLVDNGFMYTSDGWGTIYKIDARQPDRGSYVWIADPGVEHEGNTSRTRGIALWEQLVVANLPDGRVIALDRNTGEIHLGPGCRAADGARRTGSVPRGAARSRRDGHHPERHRRRRHARLGRRARRGDRRGKVALVRRAGAGPTRQRDLEGRPQRVEDGRRRGSGRPVRTTPRRISTSSARAIRIRFTTRSSAPATTSTRTRWSRSTSRRASAPGTSSTRRTTRGTTTKWVSTCCTTP